MLNYFERVAAAYSFKENEMCRHEIEFQGMPIEVFPVPGFFRKKDFESGKWEIIVKCPICSKRYDATEKELQKFIDSMEEMRDEVKREEDGKEEKTKD